MKMTLRKQFKYWLYNSCPGFSGSFPYCGTNVYFPKDSHLFLLACQEGIFEPHNVRMLLKLARPNSYLFDVGTNIGLMSVPVLQAIDGIRIVSFEPSPNNVPSLRKTIDAHAARDRWTLIPKAVGGTIGEVSFSVSAPGLGAYDGMKSTNRTQQATQITVELTTLDNEWESLGRPNVSAIKVDVEGAELGVLQGALKLMTTCRPFIMTEWNKINLKAYGVAPTALYDFCVTHNYRIVAMPNCFPILSREELELYVDQTEAFILIPTEISGFDFYQLIWGYFEKFPTPSSSIGS